MINLNESLLCEVSSLSTMVIVIVDLIYVDGAISACEHTYSDDVSICFECVGQCTYEHHILYPPCMFLLPRRQLDLLQCRPRSTCPPGQHNHRTGTYTR